MVGERMARRPDRRLAPDQTAHWRRPVCGRPSAEQAFGPLPEADPAPVAQSKVVPGAGMNNRAADLTVGARPAPGIPSARKTICGLSVL
jgi:hypothetical protein